MKIITTSLVVISILFILINPIKVSAAVNWSLNGSTVWSDGNVGIGTNYALIHYQLLELMVRVPKERL